MTTAVSLAQSVAPGVSLGYKNRLINGAMTVWQRGVGGFTTNGTYTVDCWRLTTGSSFTVTQSSNVPAGFLYSMMMVGGANCYWQNRMESLNCYDLPGKTITVSFWVQQTSGAGTQALGLSLAYPNAQDNWTSTTQINGTWYYFNTTSSWAQYTITFTNLPAGVANGLGVMFSNTGSATIYMTGVQLEVGSSATNFEFRDIQRELIMCQRYFWKFVGDPVQAIATWGNGYCRVTGTHPVPMRTAPALTFTGTTGSGDWFATIDDANYRNFGSPSSSGSTWLGYAIKLVDGGGGIGTPASATAYVQNNRDFFVSAEL